MARADESQQDDIQRTGATPRTFSSKDVHKRRAGRGLFARSKTKAVSDADADAGGDSRDAIDDFPDDVPVDNDAATPVDASIRTDGPARNTGSIPAFADEAPAENDRPDDAPAERRFTLDERGASAEADAGTNVDPDVDPGASPDADADDAFEEPDAIDDADANLANDADANPDADAPDDADFDADVEGGLPEEAPDAPPAAPLKPRTIFKRIVIGIVAVIIVAAIGLCSAFAWDRWGRYDDYLDMQGQWYVAGTTVPVEIDGHTIHLTEDISYECQLDDHAKTLTYTFGPMKGQGRYWFSGDRRFLAITDGANYTGVSTLLEDLNHLCNDIVHGVGATGTQLPRGDGVITLCREPGKLAEMAEDAMARAKKRAVREKERKQRELERQEAAAAEAEAEEGAETEEYIETDEVYVASEEPEPESEGEATGEGEDDGYSSEDDATDESTDDEAQESYAEEPSEEDGDGE